MNPTAVTEENITFNNMSQELFSPISPKHAIFGRIPGGSNINNHTANVIAGLEPGYNDSGID